MKADFFYSNVCGRLILQAIQKTGAFRPAAWFLHTGASKCRIKSYIKNNNIDMTPFKGQSYDSFASFFARKREDFFIEGGERDLIAPCDSFFSAFEITPELELEMKGSVYALSDVIPDEKTAEKFRCGLCLVFRLEASDYHHFCFFDDGELGETHFIPGQLHSVQPVAQRSVPVYRLNRRWWTLLKTRCFGDAVQVEIGAMLVGGVSFAKQSGSFKRGEEMGNFELAGSTVLLLLDSSVKKRLVFKEAFAPALKGEEIKVSMGKVIGELKE